MEELRDILRRRRAGERSDAFRLVLCLDSGGMKGSVLAGMCLALDEVGLLDCFDALYGSSSGALVGAYSLAGQPQAAEVFWRELSGDRFVRPWLTPLGGAMHMNYLFDAVLLQRHPLQWRRLLERGPEFHPLVANATHGVRDGAEVFDLHSEWGMMSALRAAVRVPVICANPWSRVPDLWWDAGLHQPVPFQLPLAGGATHLLLLRSAPQGHQPQGPLNRTHDLAKRLLARPITGSASAGRHRQEALIRRSPRWQLQQVFPPAGLEYSFFCRDPQRLREYAQAGYAAVQAWWGERPPLAPGGW